MAQRSEQEILNASYIAATSALRVGASLSFSTDATNNRVSAFQTDAGKNMVSCRSDDAGLMRVSALGVNITDVTNTDASDFHVSAYSGDGNQFHVSAVQGDGALMRISAIQMDGANLIVSARSDDAGLFHTSTFIDSGSVSAMQAAANNFRVSCFQTTAADLKNAPSQDDASLLHTSALLYDGEYLAGPNVIVSARNVTPSSAMKGLLVTVVGADATYNRVSAFLDSGSISAMQGAANNLRVSAFVDSGSISAMQSNGSNLRASAFSLDAATFMVSARSDDAALFHVSTIGTLTVSAHEIKQSDAASLMVSGRSDDAGLFHVSAIGTLTVSAHEVKQSDASSLRCSAFISQAGDPTYTIINTNQRISAAGGTAILTPTAGKSIRVTDLIFSSVSANACYIIGAANSIKSGVFFFAANGGAVMNFKTPFTLSANEVLGISADNANSIGLSMLSYEV